MVFTKDVGVPSLGLKIGSKAWQTQTPLLMQSLHFLTLFLSLARRTPLNRDGAVNKSNTDKATCTNPEVYLVYTGKTLLRAKPLILI
jgi:hypothetical protein